jgi:hypothetical protein
LGWEVNYRGIVKGTGLAVCVKKVYQRYHLAPPDEALGDEGFLEVLLTGQS